MNHSTMHSPFISKKHWFNSFGLGMVEVMYVILLELKGYQSLQQKHVLFTNFETNAYIR